MKRPLVACGLMSGTSRDGVDAALVKITGRFPDNAIKLLYAETVPYPAALRAMLTGDAARLGAAQVATLDFAVGACFGRVALAAIRRAGLKPADVTVIGSHGQTLLHLPRGTRLGRALVRSTLQVGRGSVIAEATGVTTIADFRSADLAVGGEGAPLVPIFDYVVLRSRTRSRLALNIGGIANLTAIPRNGAPTAMVSFDTGPGNCMIDTAIRRLSRGRLDFDRGGAWAAKGRADRALLAEILRHPYFRQRPPKSTGWEQFGVSYTDRLLARGKARGLDKYSMVSTVSEAAAESIARAIAAFVGPMMTPDEVIATGGGAKNRFLMGSLSQKLVTRFPRLKIAGGEAFGIDSDAKEACAFAYLAYLCLEGIPANVASQAAGLKPAVLGAIYPGPPGSGPRTCSSPHRRRLRC